MIALAYQRTSQRFEAKVPVMIEDFRTGFYYDAIIYNYSADGVYLESDYAPRPGRKLRLNIKETPEIFPVHTYLAEVRWRRSLSEHRAEHLFGSGLKYC